MAETNRVKNTGLRGVPVADTKISYIDGKNGILIYRGFRIEELAERSSFMEVAYLLLKGVLPTRDQLEEFSGRVTAARKIPDYLVETFKKLPRESDPMDVLQAAAPLLAMSDSEIRSETRDANLNMAIRLIARIPSAVAAWSRIRDGEEPVPPDESLSHAANFLMELHGRKPDPDMAKDLDICLVLHADHTFNASTFACREVVSTKAHMYAGVAAGIGALSGSLHGGANTRVMKMLFELEEAVKSGMSVDAWVRQRLDEGKKIMGMGHAVYKTVDPRAKILKEMSLKWGHKLDQEKWYRWLTEIEEKALSEFAAKGKTEIKSNVDFYSGSVYHMMGIPVDLMTPIFAISRVAGWCSHIIEEKFAEAQEKPALYRPEAEYIGDYCGPIGCVYQPVEARQGRGAAS